MLMGLGSILGPLLAGVAMFVVGPRGLFLVTTLAHGLLVGQAIWRTTRRPPVGREDKVDFVPIPAVRSTPETLAMSAEPALAERR